jgi:hypothetical protein
MGKFLSPPFYTLNILFYELISHAFVDINSLETLLLTFVVDRVAKSPNAPLAFAIIVVMGIAGSTSPN